MKALWLALLLWPAIAASQTPPNLREVKGISCKVERVGDPAKNQSLSYTTTIIVNFHNTGETWKDWKVYLIPPRASLKEQQKIRRKATLACADWMTEIENAKEAANDKRTGSQPGSPRPP